MHTGPAAPGHRPALAAPRAAPSNGIDRAWTLALVLLPWAVLIVLLADARPYWVFETDSEADYYYNAQLILTNGVPRGFLHPGTPAYYFMAALVGAVGRAVELTQRCFNVGYVVMAALSSWVIWRTLGRFRDESRRAAGIGLALILAWPAVVTHWGYLGSDAFIPVAGIPVILAAYESLSSREGPWPPWRAHAQRWAAVGLGFCLALKLSFVPVALAFLAGAAVHRWQGAAENGPRSRVRAAVGAVRLGGWMAAAFLLFTLPSLPRLPATLLGNFSRGDVRPQGNLLTALATALGALLYRTPVMVLALGMVGTLLVLTGGRALRAAAARGASPQPPAAAGRAAELPGLVFLAATWLGLVYALAASAGDVTRGWDVGLLVRNATPAALIVLPTVLYLTANRPGLAAWLHRPYVVPALLCLILVPALASSLVFRHRTVAARLEKIAATTQALDQLRAGRPVALWDSVGDQGGAPAFHHWGNYRYGADRFDRSLLYAFPEQGLIRLREVHRIRRIETGPPVPPLPGRAAAAAERWTRLFPGSLRRPSSELLSGQDLGFRPRIVAFPIVAENELKPASVEDAMALLGHTFGAVDASVQQVAGEPWRIVRLGGEAGPPRWSHALAPRSGPGLSSKIDPISGGQP